MLRNTGTAGLGAGFNTGRAGAGDRKRGHLVLVLPLESPARVLQCSGLWVWQPIHA